MQRYNEGDPRNEQYEGGNQQMYSQGNYQNIEMNINGNMNHNVDNGFLGKVALVLSIMSFICCCVNWLFFIPAIICAVIAIIKNKRDVSAWAAIIISCISFGFYIIVIVTGAADDLAASLEETETTEEISSIGNSEDSLENVFDSPQAVNQSGDSLENNKVKTVGINEEFGNSTITGVVTDVDMNYTEYNDFWSEVPEGYKVIFITIKVTNKSDAENYVSVGDFECYVDDIITEPELVAGGNLDYNANIAPGRTALLGAEYIIPINTEAIELEYNPIGEKADRVIIKIK